MSPNSIRNIVFDFGNVLIDLDVPRTEALFNAWGGPAYAAVGKACREEGIFEKFECGQISAEYFLYRIGGGEQRLMSEEQVADAWNAMLLQIPARRFEMLLRLRERYRVFLLSNTNEIHLDWIYHYLQRQHQVTDWDSRYFDKTYYSHHVGLRKPNADIFEHVLQDAGIQAADSLFIDDNADNIRTAQILDFQTILHPIGAEVADALAPLLA